MNFFLKVWSYLFNEDNVVPYLPIDEKEESGDNNATDKDIKIKKHIYYFIAGAIFSIVIYYYSENIITAVSPISPYFRNIFNLLFDGDTGNGGTDESSPKDNTNSSDKNNDNNNCSSSINNESKNSIIERRGRRLNKDTEDEIQDIITKRKLNIYGLTIDTNTHDSTIPFIEDSSSNSSSADNTPIPSPTIFTSGEEENGNITPKAKQKSFSSKWF